MKARGPDRESEQSKNTLTKKIVPQGLDSPRRMSNSRDMDSAAATNTVTLQILALDNLTGNYVDAGTIAWEASDTEYAALIEKVGGTALDMDRGEKGELFIVDANNHIRAALIPKHETARKKAPRGLDVVRKVSNNTCMKTTRTAAADALRTAYDALSARDQDRSVYVDQLIATSGVPLDEAVDVLKSAACAGKAAYSCGEPTLANDAQRCIGHFWGLQQPVVFFCFVDQN